MDTLTETIAREKAMLHERLERIRAAQAEKSDDNSERSVGKLYEVFKALGE